MLDTLWESVLILFSGAEGLLFPFGLFFFVTKKFFQFFENGDSSVRGLIIASFIS